MNLIWHLNETRRIDGSNENALEVFALCFCRVTTCILREKLTRFTCWLSSWIMYVVVFLALRQWMNSSFIALKRADTAQISHLNLYSQALQSDSNISEYIKRITHISHEAGFIFASACQRLSVSCTKKCVGHPPYRIKNIPCHLFWTGVLLLCLICHRL